MKAGWKVRPLGEVVTLNYGKAINKDLRAETGSVPVFGANGVMDYCEAALSSGPSLIIGRKGSAGAINLVDGPFWASDVSYFTTHDRELLDFGFLHYQLQSMNLPSLAKGVKPGINREEVYSLPIPLPPLEEQQQIVAVLDEAFEGLSRARAHAEANLRDARELFASFLGEIARRHAETYGTATVDELASEVTDGDHMPPPKADVGIPFITISNVNKDTRKIDLSNTFMVPETYYNALKDKRKPRAGDVLYTVTGSFGIPILVEGNQPFCFQRHIALIRPNAGVDSEWLFYMLLSPFAFDQANDGATGTAQRTVSLKALRGLTLPKTPIDIQAELAANLRARWEANQIIVERYRAKIADIDTLRQSLLQKAFAGELTKRSAAVTTGNPDFDAVLDEVFATPLTPEEIAENRRRNPKGARMVDEVRKIMGFSSIE